MKRYLFFMMSVLCCLSAAAREVKSVVMVGNSLTRHLPAPKLGWEGDWGMAATVMDRDYAHLLFQKICGKLAGKQAQMPQLSLPKGVISERDFSNVKPELVKDADILIIQLGDNFRRPQSYDAERDFYRPYTQMLQQLCGDGRPRLVICLSNWGDPGMPGYIERAAAEHQVAYVNIAKLFADPANRAISEGHFTNSSVNWHPGDQGMAKIADTVWGIMEPLLERWINENEVAAVPAAR